MSDKDQGGQDSPEQGKPGDTGKQSGGDPKK